jgi:hypothetical protein
MDGSVLSDQMEQINALDKVRQTIAQATAHFPISEIVVPLADAFDWLLDDASTEEQWFERQQSFQRRFAERWKVISERAIDPEARQISDQALTDSSYDPLAGAQPWGVELTHVLRAALAELAPVTEEAPRVLPGSERVRAFTRAMNVQSSQFILPLISHAPLLESEWEAILERLNDLLELALSFEGSMVVWLIGGFYRDVNGRLTLHPQLSFTLPQPGTRVKPIHVLLGTAYEEQCPSLLPLVRAARGQKRRPSDALLRETPWHRVALQLNVTTEDYELLNPSRLSDNERELARQVMYLSQQPRGQHVLEGAVQEVPRPWRQPVPAADLTETRPPAIETHVLPPQPALDAASQPPVVSEGAIPTIESLHQDAEELRRKGMAAVASDPAIAQKYLLASTVLENTSVDVWLTLVDLAATPKQKEAFRREAEKALKRQRQEK